MNMLCLQTVNITNHTKGKITCVWMKGRMLNIFNWKKLIVESVLDESIIIIPKAELHMNTTGMLSNFIYTGQPLHLYNWHQYGPCLLQRNDHSTGNFMPYSLRIVYGFFFTSHRTMNIEGL